MAKKKKTKDSKGFSFKEFLIFHVEKLIFGLVLLLAGGLVALGFLAQPYSTSKTPEKLTTQANQVSQQIKENHWDEIVKSQTPIVTNFREASNASRKPIQVDRISIFPQPDKSANRRGDPALSAPIKLRAKYYYGPLAFALPPKKTDPLEKLEDAKKAEEAKPRGSNRNKMNQGAMGYGGEGGEGGGAMGYGAGGYPGSGGEMGGGMGGMGAPMGIRLLNPAYDRGFQMGMQTFMEPMMGGMPGGTPGGMPGGLPGGPGMTGQTTTGGTPGSQGTTGTGTIVPEVKKPQSKAIGFVAVTALAPHKDMEDAYRAEFADAPGFIDGRDTPTYVGFEVQRVEITEANYNRPIDESEWKDLPRASYDYSKIKFDKNEKNEDYKSLSRGLIGTCAEVCNPNWVDPNISMPIPPVLLNDYRQFAAHPDIPQVVPDPLETEWEPANVGTVGYGGGYGMGMGGEGTMGYGGSGYGEGGAMGYGSEMGAAGGGYGSEGMGMGMGYGGEMGGGGYGMGSQSMGPQVSLPRRLPSTKYKLVRFFDTAPPPGVTYRYRVRLLMYDSNFPEYNVFQPRSNTLKTDAVLRVQKLLAQHEPKEVRPRPNDPASQMARPPVRRPSKRESPWSEPSDPVTTMLPPPVFAGFGEGTKLTPELVVAEFDRDFALYVPNKYNFELGAVMGSFKKEKGKDAPEVVLPTIKVIKSFKTPKETQMPKINEYAPGYRITAIDARGYTNLGYSNSKDSLRSGMELVTYDTGTGQLIVSREFEDFTGFNMHTKPDAPAVGPLGGGLKSDGGGMGGMYGGYGGGEGGAMGGMGGGKMGGSMP
jgi:hypothetical protein